MNWPSYKFSKESEPELLEFLKVVSKKNDQSFISIEQKELWQRFLPIDEDVLQKMSLIKSSEIECIDITSSDDELDQPKCEEDLTHLTSNATKLNVCATDDLIDGVKELLETEDRLSEDIIKQFGRECLPQQLEDIFVLFSKELNEECISKLWESISNCNGNERDLVAFYFSRFILSSKVLTREVFVKELLRKMFNTASEIILTDLVRLLCETTDTKELIILRKHLNVLSDSQKNQLLEQFLKCCSGVIEDKHIASVLSLLTKNTDLNNIDRIVMVLHNVAKEFAEDKTFGKLVVEVLEILGSNIMRFEPQMKHVAGIHKSVYASQINKMFSGLMRDYRHDMSFNISRI